MSRRTSLSNYYYLWNTRTQVDPTIRLLLRLLLLCLLAKFVPSQIAHAETRVCTLPYFQTYWASFYFRIHLFSLSLFDSRSGSCLHLLASLYLSLFPPFLFFILAVHYQEGKSAYEFESRILDVLSRWHCCRMIEMLNRTAWDDAQNWVGWPERSTQWNAFFFTRLKSGMSCGWDHCVYLLILSSRLLFFRTKSMTECLNVIFILCNLSVLSLFELNSSLFHTACHREWRALGIFFFGLKNLPAVDCQYNWI